MLATKPKLDTASTIFDPLYLVKYELGNGLRKLFSSTCTFYFVLHGLPFFASRPFCMRRLVCTVSPWPLSNRWRRRAWGLVFSQSAFIKWWGSVLKRVRSGQWMAKWQRCCFNNTGLRVISALVWAPNQGFWATLIWNICRVRPKLVSAEY